jgi:hypothetical protein
MRSEHGMGRGAHTALDSLIHENVELLRSGLQVMESIPADRYREGHDRATNGGVGRHFRHILEFYERLVEQKGSTIDYESRRRDPRVETDVGYAATVVRRLIASLAALRNSPAGAPLLVITEVLDSTGQPVQTTSSTERELAVLASHTVHHYAIIALVLRGSGIMVPKHFGVAPSTLRHIARIT